MQLDTASLRSTRNSSAAPRAIPARARLSNVGGEEREWQSELVPRYRRNSAEVDQAILGVYLAGGNTRRIRSALEPLLRGAPLSKSSVSRLSEELEAASQKLLESLLSRFAAPEKDRVIW